MFCFQLSRHCGRFALLWLVGVAAAMPASAQSAPIDIALSQPGQPMTLKIGILSANIVVLGEDRRDVSLEIDGGGGGRKIITPNGSRPITGGSYRVSATEEDNVVSVSSEWRRSTIDVTARVPRSATLNLWTTNDGTIVVREVSGEMQLQNVNGPITVSGASAAVIAESVNDDIDVDFASLKGVSASALTSLNGTLSVGLPGRPNAQVHIDTARGEISSDFEIEIQPSEPKVTRSQANGSVEIAVENLIVANINGGGTVIRMKTLNGDISINKAP